MKMKASEDEDALKEKHKESRFLKFLRFTCHPGHGTCSAIMAIALSLAPKTKVNYPIDESTFLSADLHLLESLELQKRTKHIMEISEEVNWQDPDPDIMTRCWLLEKVADSMDKNSPSLPHPTVTRCQRESHLLHTVQRRAQ